VRSTRKSRARRGRARRQGPLLRGLRHRSAAASSRATCPTSRPPAPSRRTPARCSSRSSAACSSCGPVCVPVVARASRRLRHQATHDTLTGCPTAPSCTSTAPGAGRASRDGSLAALMLLDLDRFKEVNDTMGHEQGDRLLVDVARAPAPAAARRRHPGPAGGDEFAVLAVRAPPRRRRRGGDPPAPVPGPPLRRRRASPSSSAPRSASRCKPDHGVGRLDRSCATPTSRCTRPSARARTSRPNSTARDPYSSERLKPRASSATPSTTTSSSCTSSPSRAEPAAASSRGGPTVRGSTPTGGCSVRTSSSPRRGAPD
jgi:hypothetical protein